MTLPPQEIEHLYAAGWNALQSNHMTEAEENLLAVLSADPDHIDALNALGIVYFHEKRLDEAETLHKKALKNVLRFYGEKMPDHVEWEAPHDKALLRALHGIGLVNFRRGDIDEARKRFQELLNINPDDNTGAQYLLDDIEKGRASWDDSRSGSA